MRDIRNPNPVHVVVMLPDGAHVNSPTPKTAGQRKRIISPRDVVVCN
jgi:hypothetical protein